MVSSTHMALRLIPLLVLFALFASSQKSTAVSASPIEEGWGGMSSIYEETSPRKCYTKDGGGLIRDCVDEEEDEMESATSRRILAQTRRRFISYDALIKNKTPCNRRGHSYYNCVRSGKANPYRRPCTIITRCARILD